MESWQAILALSSLARSTRLGVFRLLVKHEPDGLAAGDIARALAVPQNTMSAHLAILARAGLVMSERKSRSIIYRADLAVFRVEHGTFGFVDQSSLVVEGTERLACEATLRDGRVLWDTNGLTMARYKR